MCSGEWMPLSRPVEPSRFNQAKHDYKQ
jgi:hypothetical protein